MDKTRKPNKHPLRRSPNQFKPANPATPIRPGAAYPETFKIAGLPAVAALFARDPGRVDKLFFEDRLKTKTGDFCIALAQQRKSYRVVESEELARIAGTVLHGGVVAVARPRPVAEFDPLEAQAWAQAGEPIVVLDGVGNPHNLGAIVRTMAFFGLTRLVLSDHPAQAAPTEAAYRVAEGGFEYVAVYRARRLASQLKRLQDSHRVVATALGKGQAMDRLAAAKRPVALVLGNEEDGLGPSTLAACEETVTIAGSGWVQSLNVAATAAILAHALVVGRR